MDDSTALAPVQRRELSARVERTPDADPVGAYLASLTSPVSQIGMMKALRSAVGIVLQRPLSKSEMNRQRVSVLMDEVRSFPWEHITPAHAAAMRAAIVGTRLSAASKNKMIAGIRGVIMAAWRLELIDTDRRERVKDSLKIVKAKNDEPAGRYVEFTERRALVRACKKDETARGARDAAILALLAMGLRRSEICDLDIPDFHPTSGKLAVRESKGGSTRHLHIDNGAFDAMTDWIAIRGDEPGALILPVSRGGKTVQFSRKVYGKDETQPARIKDNTIYMMLKRRSEEAGVASLTPHDFRRTFISDLLDSGVDLVTVQKLAGHSDSSTTAKYDRRDERAKKAATAKVRFPY